MFLHIISVGVGGFIGSCLRYFLTVFSAKYLSNFPFGTLLSNVIAGFLIGLTIGAERQSVLFSPNTKLLITTGFLGGLSTFSTFSLETVVLLETGNYLKASVNILLNIILSFTAVFVGFLLIKLIKK